VNKFKVFDKIIRVAVAEKGTPVGYTAEVTKLYGYIDNFGTEIGVYDSQWELVPEDIKPKWSIYNNTLPWSELSDKQKGKLMVAENDGHEIEGVKCTALNKPVRFDCHHIAYFAVEPEPTKPEPTMEELFIEDAGYWLPESISVFAIKMIAKGWTKPCK
jgi:hypothetical protein